MSDLHMVMAVTLVIWVGLFLYLISLDRRVSRLGREVRRNDS